MGEPIPSSAQDPGKRPATLKDVAKLAGVDVTTVSRALKNDRRISAATSERVRAIAAELHYDPARQRAARRMAMRRHGRHLPSQIILIVLPRGFAAWNYYRDVLWGVFEGCTAEDFRLLTAYFTHEDGAEKLKHLLAETEVDGIIFMQRQNLFQPVLDFLAGEPHGYPVPAVSLTRPIPGCSAVMADEWRGGYEAMDHLLELGHRDVIHFWGGYEGEYAFTHRVNGCRQAYRDRGLDPENHLRARTMDFETPHGEEQMIPQLMAAVRAEPEISALLAPFDTLAVRGYAALRENGILVPHDFSLVGWDDVDPLLDQNGRNVLTTVHMPLFEIGQQAAELLVQRITGKLTEDKNLTLPTRLIVRDSTGPCQQRHT